MREGFYMAATFKTSLFGGFDRESVVSYIEKTARSHREEVDALKAELEALRRSQSDASQELEALRQDAEEGREASRKYEELRVLADELTRRAESLAAENETLRSDAAEYRSMKDHIAQIEISAHRRTEEFRAAAIEKLHAFSGAHRVWCEEEKTRLTALYEDLERRMDEAQQLLKQADLAALDTLRNELDALDRSFDQ